MTATPRPAGGYLPLLGAPAIAGLLLLSWLFPLEAWAIAVLGAVASAVFGLVGYSQRSLGRRLLARPAVAAVLVMYVIALFTLAFASLALEQPGSIQTNGGAHPQSLGVAALLATAMGIAGGEVGAQVQEGARVIAHVQLLLVIGAVAGVGGQLLQRITGGSEPGPIAPEPEPPSPTQDLYLRVYERLLEQNGEAA